MSLVFILTSPAFAGGGSGDAAPIGPLGTLLGLAVVAFVVVLFGGMAAAPFLSKEELRQANGQD